MTVVVGYASPDDDGGSLDLGVQFARALGEKLLVVTVVPRQWSTPSFAKVDAEFGAFARELGIRSESSARSFLGHPRTGVTIDFQTVPGRSITSALLEAVEGCKASMMVLGSSADGAAGRIAVGSTTGKLLHTSPVPLALAPSGFRSTAVDGFGRITCAFSDAEQSVTVVTAAMALGRALDVPVRIASFGIRGATMYPPEVGFSAEDSVLRSWREQASAAQDQLRAKQVIGPDTETVVTTGISWDESMSSIDWAEDEVLILGSSSAGPIARVFLGSRAAKLIRHSPVPVLVYPRHDDVLGSGGPAPATV